MDKQEFQKWIPKVDSTIYQTIEGIDDPIIEDAIQVNERSRRGFTAKETIPTIEEFNPNLQPNEAGKKDAQTLLALIKHWMESNEWLTIIGGVGTGKTHLLKSAIWKTDGYYITAYDFDRRMKDFRKGMEDNNGGYTDPDVWLDRLANAERHVAIDDIGAGYIQRGWTLSKFERLIDIRYRNKFPTVIATNFDGKKLQSEMGERIVSRITDVNYGNCIVLKNCMDIRRVRNVKKISKSHKKNDKKIQQPTK
jgi:DNA replication protein DnaC